MTTAREVLDRCAELDRFTATPPQLERVYLSREHAERQRGRRPLDGAGRAAHLAGRRRQPVRPPRGSRARAAGAARSAPTSTPSPTPARYDGMLGVVMAIAVAERLRDRPTLPFALEVIGFSDEEGTRFGKALLGSQARRRHLGGGLVGPARPRRHHAAPGVPGRSASTRAGSARPRAAPRSWSATSRRTSSRAPTSRPRTARSATSPRSPARAGSGCRSSARPGTPAVRRTPAGATPWSAPARRSSLIERRARASDCIATVGRIEVQPGAVNVIPGRADFSLDLRAATDAERDEMWDVAARRDRGGCARPRGLRFEVRETHNAPGDAVRAVAPARPCIAGIRSTGDDDPMGLWSRAGHDAMAVGLTTDVGMLFLRCYDGISHHPDEDVRELDVAAGLDALEAAVLAVAAQVASRSARDEPSGSTSGSPQRYAELSPQERRAAETLLEHLDDLATYRSAELAELAGVSKATMSRLFRSLGFADFDEVRDHLRALRTAGRAAPGRRRADACRPPRPRAGVAAARAREPGARRRRRRCSAGARRVLVVGLAQQPPGRAAPAPAARARARPTYGWRRCRAR